jgi:hypothetical protein
LIVDREALHPLKSTRQPGATAATSSGITLDIRWLQGEMTLTTIQR